MKHQIFDRTKYYESLNKLIKRNAPDYIIEAYKEGFTNIVNAYYKIKLSKGTSDLHVESLSHNIDIIINKLGISYSIIESALKKVDIDFIKALYQMTNLDIVTGNKLPTDASKLVMQGPVKDIGLKDLFKKLR